MQSYLQMFAPHGAHDHSLDKSSYLQHLAEPNMNEVVSLKLTKKITEIKQRQVLLLKIRLP